MWLFALTLPPAYSASSGLVEASIQDAIFTSSLAGAGLHSPAHMFLLHLTHLTIISFNSVTINEGAGFSCDGVIEVATSLQLKILNQITIPFVQSNALKGSSSGWHKSCMQTGHCNCFKIVGYLCVQLVMRC